MRSQYPFEPLLYSREPLVLTFKECVKLLRAAGENIGNYEDFT